MTSVFQMIARDFIDPFFHLQTTKFRGASFIVKGILSVAFSTDLKECLQGSQQPSKHFHTVLAKTDSVPTFSCHLIHIILVIC